MEIEAPSTQPTVVGVQEPLLERIEVSFDAGAIGLIAGIGLVFVAVVAWARKVDKDDDR